MGRTAQETVNNVPQQESEFPEFTVKEEEVAGNFYYRQLTKEDQTVYRELLQGVREMK